MDALGGRGAVGRRALHRGGRRRRALDQLDRRRRAGVRRDAVLGGVLGRVAAPAGPLHPDGAHRLDHRDRRRLLRGVVGAGAGGDPVGRDLLVELDADGRVVAGVPGLRLRRLVHRGAAARRDPHRGLQQPHAGGRHRHRPALDRRAHHPRPDRRRRRHPRRRVPDPAVLGGRHAASRLQRASCPTEPPSGR